MADIVWTSKDVWTLVVATGVFSAAASFALSSIGDGIKRWRTGKTLARYTAMRCAVVLEQYATECWDTFAMANGEYDLHHDMTPQALPKAPVFPSDLDWKAISQDLSDEVLSFSNASSVSQTLAKYSEFWERNPFDFHSAAKERGYEALKLGGRLRNAHNLRPVRGIDRIWKDFSS